MAAPIINVDRESMNALELKVIELSLYQMADVINRLTKKGAIYGQIILSDEEAALKRQAMGGQ